MTAIDTRPVASVNSFLARFISLSVLAGMTIGMGNVITTLFALHLGASSLQIGLISGSATLGMLLVALPAGYLIARFGARNIYLLASLNCALVYLIVPWLTLWPLLALARGIVGVSVPFRTISMNSTFLQRVREFGTGKAGWYRASQQTGMALIGPWIGTLLTQSLSFFLSYLCLSALFAAMAIWSQNFLPDAEPVSDHTAAPAGGFVQEIRTMLSDIWVAESCLTEFVNSSTSALFSSFIIVLAVKDLGWRPAEAVTLVTTQGLSLILFLFVLGPLLGRLPISVPYFLSVACASAAMLLIGFGRSLPVLMLGAVSLAAGATLIHLVNMVRLAGSPLPKSKISSLLNLAGQGGSLLGSVAGCFLSAVFGLSHVFLIWLPLIWAAALFCLLRFHLVRWRGATA